MGSLRTPFSARPGTTSRAGRSCCPIAALPALRAVGADRMPPDVLLDLIAAGVPDRLVALGDPGVAFDV